MNNRLFTLKVSILFALLLGSVGSVIGQKTEYYRHLIFRESPYSDTRGNHPIDRKTADQEAHYRFVYDNQDRLVEVSHRIGEFLIADNGNWDNFIWFSPKMTIEYSGDQEVRYYFNHLDEKIEAHGKMYKAVFKLNQEGQRTSVKFYDSNNELSENSWGIHSYQWSHLKEGHVMEKRFDLEGKPRTVRPDFTFYTVRLEYGNDDLLDFMYHLDDEGNIINNVMKAGVDRIVYDQEENFSRWMVFDKELKPVEGNAPEFAIGEHLYDSRGNKVELRGFDVAGKNKAMPDGVARVINTYDKFNNQIEVKAYDLNGNLLQRATREFTSDGRNIKSIKVFDAKDNVLIHSVGEFAKVVSVPEVITFGESMALLKERLLPLCDSVSMKLDEPIQLPTAKNTQTQLDCFGFEFAGKKRKIELIFADDQLDIVWILTEAEEERFFVDRYSELYGKPTHITEEVTFFLNNGVAVRNVPHEVLFISERLIEPYRQFLGNS